MKKIFESNLWLIAGIGLLVLGGIEVYQTTILPRLHKDSSYGVN